MAVTSTPFGKLGYHISVDPINWTSNTIKAALMGSGYTFAQDTQEFWSDVSAQEIAVVSGYTAGGTSIPSRVTPVYDATTHRTRYKAGSSLWTAPVGVTIAAFGAVIYKDTGTSTTSPLMGYLAFGTSLSATNDILRIDWDTTDGVWYIQA